MMEGWLLGLLILSIILNLVTLVFGYFVVSGLAQVIQRQKSLNESQQQLSDQMADLEEQFVETKSDIRKVSQYFVNFAKSLRQGTDKPWYTGV